MSASVSTQIKYPKYPEDIENEQNVIEELKKLTPLPLKLKGFALNHNVLQLKQLGAEEEAEIEKINSAAQKNFQQHIGNINDVINGTRKPTDEELKQLEEYLTEEEKGKKDELLNSLKPIPEYWSTVLNNDLNLKHLINENDSAALKHLTKCEYKFSEDAATPHNFTITMTFTPNDYFENDVLSVTLHMKEPRDITKTEGTEIKWKEGKDTTKKSVSKKQKNKKTGQTRTVTKEEDVPSFFNLFKSNVAVDEEKELDEEEEAQQEQILDQMDQGYALIEELIPFSLEYFLGIRKEFGGEDDEDFDDEDMEDDDDEEEDEKPAKGKGKKATPGAAGGEAGKQECKQQ